MFLIIGSLVVTLCVLVPFAQHGGNLMVLWQPAEFIIIGGAAAGSVLIAAPIPVIKEMMHQLQLQLKGKSPTKEEYVQLLMLLFEIIKTAKGNPLSLEAHVEKPEASEIFKKYPSVIANHHALHFLTDTLKVQISSPMSPYDLEDLMDKDIEAMHNEELRAPSLMGKVGDAMPGLGIVAAVLGVVSTMGKLSQGKEVIGQSVAAALVGTFIGILVSYGFLQPIAQKMELQIADAGQIMHVIKQALIAFAKDCSPKVCVEFARRSIPPGVRPDFEAVDKATSNIGKAAA
jgi:chemotaxis protein MotA